MQNNILSGGAVQQALARWLPDLMPGLPGPVAIGQLPPGPGWALYPAGQKVTARRTDLLGRVTLRWQLDFRLLLRLPQPEGDPDSAARNVALVQELCGRIRCGPWPLPGLEPAADADGPIRTAVTQGGCTAYTLGLTVRYSTIQEP